MNIQAIRRTVQTVAATALVAFGLPQAASAADVQFGTGIAAAERFRAADNGSADVRVATTVNGAAAATEADRHAVAPKAVDLRAPELRAPDLRRPDLRAPDLRAPDLRRPDLRRPDLRTPDLRAPDLRRPDLRTPELRRPD